MWTLRKDKEGVAKRPTPREWSGLGNYTGAKCEKSRQVWIGWLVGLDWKKFVNKREWLAVAALHKLNSKAKCN